MMSCVNFNKKNLLHFKIKNNNNKEFTIYF